MRGVCGTRAEVACLQGPVWRCPYGSSSTCLRLALWLCPLSPLQHIPLLQVACRRAHWAHPLRQQAALASWHLVSLRGPWTEEDLSSGTGFCQESQGILP